MTAIHAAIVALRELLRPLLLVLAATVAVVCVVDWLVRTRRLNPFGPLARWFRKHVDPMMAPIERRVVRAGGLPASAPWWVLGAVVVGSILLLALIDGLAGLVLGLSRGLDGGPRGISLLLVSWAFTLLRLALVVRVVTSWLPISRHARWVRWSFTLTEPMLRPLQRVIPPFGAIDISPLVAFFGLVILEGLVRAALT